MVSMAITRRRRSETTEVVNKKPDEGDVVDQFGFACPAGPALGRSCTTTFGVSDPYMYSTENRMQERSSIICERNDNEKLPKIECPGHESSF